MTPHLPGATSRLRNDYGRAMDELDRLKLRIAARDLAAQRGMTAYCVTTVCGEPILGLHDGSPSAQLVATEWSMR